jgi:hypothetical protein
MSFKPTYLYIKRHSITGKCYFGKTVQKDPVKYPGSGLVWTKHLKKHGYEYVETLWVKLFVDQEECTRIALLFSKQQDIVKSSLWLNLKNEDGLMGGGDQWKGKKSIDHQEKITNALRGKKFSDERKLDCSKRMSGSGNSRALKWTIEKENGQIFVIDSLKTWCSDKGIPFSSLALTLKSGKFSHGFRAINKEKCATRRT